jgi:hypothetical protein
MRFFLLRVMVLACPDVARQVAEHAGEVMVAAATGRGGLAQLATAHDATESLMLGARPESGAAPKRGAMLFDQRT